MENQTQQNKMIQQQQNSKLRRKTQNVEPKQPYKYTKVEI